MNVRQWFKDLDRRDVIAPASFITVFGLILCLIGATRLNTTAGLWLILLGRSMDLIDGPVSRATRPTHFGAALDAASDKIALIAIISACFYYDLAPWWALAYIIVHNVVNAAAALLAESRGKQPTTAISGKLSMFGENIAILLFVINAVPAFNANTFALAAAALLLSVPLGVRASYKYLQVAANYK